MTDFQLKVMQADGIPQALERAKQYRLLNQPFHAESICRDILAADPENQEVHVVLILAMTDQFGHELGSKSSKVKEVLKNVTDPYLKLYYRGLIYERRGIATLKGRAHSSREVAYDLLEKAIDHYNQAYEIRPENNEEALLRHNTCVRTIEAKGLVKEISEQFVAYHD
jgi:tetratricopeptide (TPR) repeat protein